ncbi:hypothetical protein I317_03494 [Kwoniella heveanensis CBS 569]|nr:hypothetical protein I317_03494 [Kwoniella heveanensis CBS 569]
MAAVVHPSTTTTTMKASDDLAQSLERHNATFTTLLSLIPAQYYIAPDPEVADSKWMKNKKRKTGEEIKESKRKSKQEKLDPSSKLTTADLLEAQNKPSGNVTAATGTANEQPEAAIVKPLPPSASISELRAKLQSRLDSFRRDRGINDDDGEDGQGALSRNELEEARRKRRGEMRDKRRKDRKEERKKGREEVKAKPAKTQLIVPQLRDEPDSLSFPAVSLPSSTKTKSKSNLKQISNPAQALAHLEKHNAHLASLPEDKRKEAEERERWAKAEERAAGGKVADQEKVLKKAVKRVEKTKAKSSREWADRKRELEKSNAISIKKRNDNIAKRAEDRRNKRLGIKDKGGKGHKGKSGSGSGGPNKGGKKGGSRPGFEGKKGKGGKA